jgi:integrase
VSFQRNLLKPKAVDPKKNAHYLDDETREGIIKLLLNYKHRVIARIQNSTGVRAGDVIRLKRGTISYEAYMDKAVVMRIDFEGKGGKHFVKWIFDEAIQTQIDLFIKSNILDTEYYFLERPNEVMDNFRKAYHSNYRKYWLDLKQALRVYGVEYKEWATHDFRRSFARTIWDNTKDPVVLKEMLNHAQFDTTLRYLRGSGLQSKDVYYELNEKKKEEE